ncbi:MAG: TIGR03905 family TSCPD domain-containing protein [Bacteroidales bacterium]|nr:TIGR03905 family TSCPD domain-containing protein [Bacteroidales bacterium]
MKQLTYQTHGTCSQEIIIELDDNNIIQHVEFIGGCAGNTQGLSKLLVGMKAEDAVQRLSGITCGWKPTSCPDQLAKALKTVL